MCDKTVIVRENEEFSGNLQWRMPYISGGSPSNNRQLGSFIAVYSVEDSLRLSVPCKYTNYMPQKRNSAAQLWVSAVFSRENRGIKERRMLVLERKVNEKVYIGENVVIEVIRCERGKVWIGIEAPIGVKIRRDDMKKGQTG